MTVDADTIVQQIFCAICGQGTGEFTDGPWPDNPRCEDCRNLADPYPPGQTAYGTVTMPDTATDEAPPLTVTAGQRLTVDPVTRLRWAGAETITTQPVDPDPDLTARACQSCGEIGAWDIRFNATVFLNDPLENIEWDPAAGRYAVNYSLLRNRNATDADFGDIRIVCGECGESMNPQPRFRINYGQ